MSNDYTPATGDQVRQMRDAEKAIKAHRAQREAMDRVNAAYSAGYVTEAEHKNLFALALDFLSGKG